MAEGSGADDDVKAPKERYSQMLDNWSVNRTSFVDDLRFGRLGEQWPDDVKQDRIRAGRPCLTINGLPTIIRQVVNDARQNRPSIDVKPVDGGADIRTANIFGGLIKNIEYVSNADVAYDTAIDFAVSGGFGFWRVDVDYAGPRSFDTEIRINRIENPLTVLWDPQSKAADSSDWKDAFISDMWLKEAFEKAYPGAVCSSFGDAEDYDEPWWDDSSDMVRVAEYFFREEVMIDLVKMSNGMIFDGDKLADDEQLRAMLDAQGVTVVGQREALDYKVQHWLMSGAEVLEKTEWLGKYIPIVPVFGEDINVEGRRHLRSLIRDAKDPQQMKNYWRTTSTELVALAPKAPWIGKTGTFTTDAEKWATANTKNHAYIEYDGNDAPNREPFAGIPAGALQEALNASDDIKSVTGLYDASMGARSNETSGRAIMFRQREGDVSTYHFIDNLSRSIRHTGKILVDLIPKIYDEPKIVRIMNEDGKPQNVAVGPQGSPPPEGMAEVFDLNVGNYDVAVTAGPSFTTKREETANQMLEFLRVMPQAAPLMGDIIAKNMDWKDSDKLAERLAKLLPPGMDGQPAPEQGPPPEVQAIMAKAQAEAQALQAKTQSEIEADTAKALNKMQLDRQAADQKMAIKREEAQLNAILKASNHGQPTTPVMPLT